MKQSRGFTLLEVLVALVIVAFGMGAVLAALSSSADNISSLRERTIAQWVAMNQIADARLNSNLPKRGVTEGDVKNFGGIDWHWRQDVMAVEMVPGLMEIAVRVRRATPGSSRSSSSSDSTTASTTQRGGSGNSANSSGAPSSSFGSSGGISSSSSGAFGASSGLGALRSGLLSSSGGSANRNIGATSLPSTGDDQHWIATVVGFRGDALGQPNGESPDWGGSPCTPATGASSGTTSGTASSGSSGANPCSNASSSSGASSSGSATTGPSNTTQPSQSSTSSGSTGTNQP